METKSASGAIMSNEEEKRCPLCAEEMDWTDQQLNPCKCGYQVCVWCWHHIMDMAEKDETEGRCPACRTPYDKEKIVGVEAKFERVVANNTNRKQKPPKAKPKTNEARKDLTNVRVIQRRMAYVIGLPLCLADEDLLHRKEYFGQYGKVTKISLSRTAGGTVQQFPCNNAGCLYLHTVGAEEDSFGKEEVAAVHTRTRVQQIVGAVPNIQRRSGNVLPPPLDENFSYSSTSSDKLAVKSGPKDVVLGTVTSSRHLTSLPSSNSNDGSVRMPDDMTTFVDVVGRSCSPGSEKDGDVAEDTRVLNLCSELSSVSINRYNHGEVVQTDRMLCNAGQLDNGLARNEEFKEPFREPLNLLAVDRADITHSDAYLTKEQSLLTLGFGRQGLHGPLVKDSDGRSQKVSLLPSSYPSKIPEVSRDQAWRYTESHTLTDYYGDHSIVNKSMDDASVKFAPLNSISNGGYSERKFQSSAKSDRVYRSSNSFSNEEIVEHLRRLDDDDMANGKEDPALDAVKSSIISNIMSLDFDACDDSSTVPHSSDGTDGRDASSWNSYNSDYLGYSFAKPEGLTSQPTLSNSSFNKGQEPKKYSVLQDSSLVENKEQYLHKPQYHVSRAQTLAPPGFSLPSPPPGFPACERADQGFRATAGSRLTSSLSSNHYRTPSTGNSSNTSDVDLVDPAILLVGRGKPTSNGSVNSGLDMMSAYATQPSAYEGEARHWLLTQQSALTHHDQTFPQTYMQQTPAAHQEFRYSGRVGDGFSSWDDNSTYGISTRLMDQRQTHDPSFLQFSQHKYTNGHVSNGFQAGPGEAQRRNDLGMSEFQRNERLGLNNFYPGYGDLMYQMPSTGDVYTRVFGM
ncbi:hypothetical protein RJ639_021748 [Escallonia herrerae]|uniref:RING-type domain-containing protein n=1 Tax=Escallonia herrerae TaxID=1293975 RepID=A0AA89AGQ9_9ASTE|nr:hypothetical protein RJ639_021748 [Escallonia herrerae]